MKQILLLRHPQTAYNVSPVRLRGALDIPLSPEGFGQIPVIAKRLRETFKDVKQIYSSPLARASILATTVAHEYGLTVTKLDQLSSWDYGVLNGKLVDEVIEVLKALSTGAGRELAPKGGESMNDFLHRLAEAIKKIVYEAPEDGYVVVVTHLQNIMMSKAYLEQGLPDINAFKYHYSEDNEIEPGQWRLLKREWTSG